MPAIRETTDKNSSASLTSLNAKQTEMSHDDGLYDVSHSGRPGITGYRSNPSSESDLGTNEQRRDQPGKA